MWEAVPFGGRTCIEMPLRRLHAGNIRAARAVLWSDYGEKRMNTKIRKSGKSVIRSIYDLSTPLVDKYYREVRKRVRFPRYYKKALNW